MNMLLASYFIGTSFGLLLCVQYIAFYILFSRYSSVKKVKDDFIYITLMGITILMFGIFGLIELMTPLPHLKVLFYKMKLASTIFTILFYVMLLRHILVTIKDMTFVETDEYKDITKKYLFIVFLFSLAMIAIIMFTDLIIDQTLRYTLTGLIYPLYIMTISIIEFVEFNRILKKEEGKINRINKRQFKIVLLSGLIPIVLGLIEIGLRFFSTNSLVDKVGSLYMYGVFFLVLGLSLSLIFEYMGVLANMTESNRKLSDLNKKIMDEVRTAQSLQMSLLPIDKQREIQKLLDMEISYMPMQSVGGDYYDFYQIGDRKIMMLIGDASGHGIYAAMIWAMLKVEVEEIIEENSVSDLAQVFSLLNNRITKLLENTYSYATLFSCLIDLENHTLSYISAGHTDQLYFSKRDKGVVRIRNRNPIIGTFRNAKYFSETITNYEGDVVLLFTDGVPEGVNPEGKQLGESRLEDIFLEACKNADTSSNILKNILSEIEEYCEGAIQHDDRTIMVIKL